MKYPQAPGSFFSRHISVCPYLLEYLVYLHRISSICSVAIDQQPEDLRCTIPNQIAAKTSFPRKQTNVCDLSRNWRQKLEMYIVNIQTAISLKLFRNSNTSYVVPYCISFQCFNQFCQVSILTAAVFLSLIPVEPFLRPTCNTGAHKCSLQILQGILKSCGNGQKVNRTSLV